MPERVVLRMPADTFVLGDASLVPIRAPRSLERTRESTA